jgi:hypothetical protein
MDKNTELLNYIYQNSEMGIGTIKQLIEIVEDDDFLLQLKYQLSEYESINKTSLDRLKSLGHEEVGISNMVKISSYITIVVKTLVDKSSANISELLIEGSTMGIIDATQNIEKYKSADKDILMLADRLLKTEQINVEQLKKFLA